MLQAVLVSDKRGGIWLALVALLALLLLALTLLVAPRVLARYLPLASFSSANPPSELVETPMTLEARRQRRLHALCCTRYTSMLVQ